MLEGVFIIPLLIFLSLGVVDLVAGMDSSKTFSRLANQLLYEVETEYKIPTGDFVGLVTKDACKGSSTEGGSEGRKRWF